MNCEFAINGNCQISTEMAGIPVPLDEGACRACLSGADAKKHGNHVTTDRACWALKQAGQHESARLLRFNEAPSGQVSYDRSERTRRVRASSEKQKRLIGWLQFFRIEADKGIGDTAHRLNLKSCKRPDAHAALDRLLKQCSCSRANAVERLNREWPY